GGSDVNTKFYNNVCLGKQEIMVGYDDYNALTSALDNGWTNHLVTGISADNYITLDEDDALLPRDIYGGMPRRFGRLVPSSSYVDKWGATIEDPNPLIDAGNADLDNVNNVWEGLVAEFPFLERKITGSARDLGPYECPDNTATAIKAIDASQKTVKTRKYFMDGRLVIVKDGQRYNSLGQKL
ncbi:MAG: hypothetical protein J5610_00040, partial [Prevotella sp.]|nr:hypothetical protein [Prevotella sp.]